MVTLLRSEHRISLFSCFYLSRLRGCCFRHPVDGIEAKRTLKFLGQGTLFKGAVPLCNVCHALSFGLRTSQRPPRFTSSICDTCSRAGYVEDGSLAERYREQCYARCVCVYVCVRALVGITAVVAPTQGLQSEPRSTLRATPSFFL